MIWLSAVAFAQQTPDVPDVNAQTYRPVMDAERTLWADDSGRILDGGQFKGRAFVHYAHRPLVFVPDADDVDGTNIVSDVLQFDALAMYHYDRFRIGVDIPVYLYSAGQLTQDGAGIGDIALDGRVTLLDRTDKGFGAAVGGRLTLPTSSVEAPLGLRSVGGEVFGIVDGEVEDILLAFNLGGRFVPSADLNNVKLNDQLFARLGAGWQLVDDAGVSLDLNTNLNLGEVGNIAGIPIEALLGGWGRIGDDFVLRGGVGTGLTPGVGSADFRTVVTIGYEPREDLDPDLDGLVGDEDQCPNDPEDKDDFEDLDGCPDLDNDKDGILDQADQCPNDPEDVDGFQDEDGCPDFTTQITVKVKKQNGELVPGATGTITAENVEEKGATPEFLVDLHEGTYKLAAKAPEFLPNESEFTVPLPNGKDEVVITLQPDVIMGDLKILVTNPAGEPLTDLIWYLDGGVGPAPMNEGAVTVKIPAGEHALDIRREGFITHRSKVTVPEKAQKEVVIVLQPSQVTVTKEKIDVKGTVYFDTAKATIQSRSFGLLDDVAGVLLDHPEITKVRIEGHTDSRGGADYNRTLSDKRAKSVMQYLVNKGVDQGRLTAIGYGEDRPVDDRNVAEAWEKNRRVDFFIEERSDE
ncbi:MAG: OmpA family protein [Myxococcota bacterium]